MIGQRVFVMGRMAGTGGELIDIHMHGTVLAYDPQQQATLVKFENGTQKWVQSPEVHAHQGWYG